MTSNLGYTNILVADEFFINFLFRTPSQINLILHQQEIHKNYQALFALGMKNKAQSFWFNQNSVPCFHISRLLGSSLPVCYKSQ